MIFVFVIGVLPHLRCAPFVSYTIVIKYIGINGEDIIDNDLLYTCTTVLYILFIIAFKSRLREMNRNITMTKLDFHGQIGLNEHSSRRHNEMRLLSTFPDQHVVSRLNPSFKSKPCIIYWEQ